LLLWQPGAVVPASTTTPASGGLAVGVQEIAPSKLASPTPTRATTRHGDNPITSTSAHQPSHRSHDEQLQYRTVKGCLSTQPLGMPHDLSFAGLSRLLVTAGVRLCADAHHRAESVALKHDSFYKNKTRVLLCL
jgi:hypothetical protein